MKNLVQRLRELSALIYGLGGKIVIDEAADAIEKLEAENAALKIRLGVTLDNYGYTTRERDALKAELSVLRDQKPVAWGWLIHDGVYDTICPDEHARHEGKYTVPLYAAPGAK